MLDGQSYLDLASQASGADRIRYQLLAAQAFLSAQNSSSARFVLEQIPLEQATSEQRGQYHLLLAGLLASENHWEEALSELQQPTAHFANRADWYRISGQVQAALGNFEAAASDLSQCTLLQPEVADPDPQSKPACQQQLWHLLLEMPRDRLERMQSADAHLNSWSELASILRKTTGPLELQRQAIDRWLDTHPDLAPSLPTEAWYLLTAELDVPMRIALLLPQSGPLMEAGEAVLDGILSAQFDLQAAGFATPSLTIFDTESLALADLLAQHQLEPFDLALGPLDSARVQALAKDLPPDLPMLALNRVESQTESLRTGVSLAVETEASQAARQARQLGMERALILVQDSNYGERAANAFSQQMVQQDSGSLAGLVRVSDPTALTRSMEQAFHIDQSEIRRQQLQTLLGKRLEFSPRRRQDVDVIFLASSSSLARQVGPTLAFVFAEEVPVLATSLVYDNRANAEANRDLEGVSFLAPNWLLEQSHPLPVDTDRSSDLERLEALGLDSFFLARRLTYLLQTGSDYQGLLADWQLGEDGNFFRTMEWVNIEGTEVTSTQWPDQNR